MWCVYEYPYNSDTASLFPLFSSGMVVPASLAGTLSFLPGIPPPSSMGVQRAAGDPSRLLPPGLATS